MDRMYGKPVGPIVTDNKPCLLPRRDGFDGQFIRLVPVSPAEQVRDLYAASHGDEQHLAIWSYIPYAGPFESEQAMLAWLEWCRDHTDFIFYSVIEKETNRAIGMVSYVSLVPEMQRLEVGFIWYKPEAQRTAVNTESIYLLLQEAFDEKKYRRVEWKCDALNTPSRQAALRLGFSYEGLFRQHMIINGRNRDTAWFAMTDREWPQIKNNLEFWLYHKESMYHSLTSLNAPIVQRNSII